MYEWLWELAEPLVEKLVLADAVELKYRAGRRQAKTDKIDAQFVSLLTYKDDLPFSFVPDKTTRQFRKVCRHWHATAEFLADIKIRMRWILNQHNLPVPGIAEILSAVIVSEVAGFHRFSGPDAIACYAGITERTKESGGKRSEGKISCAGPADLRWALCEAATTLVRSDPIYRTMYNHLLKNTGCKQKTKVAMARKLICWLWKIAQTREPFRRGGSTQHNRNANIARQRARSLSGLAAA